jgi:hypothetical protein
MAVAPIIAPHVDTNRAAVVSGSLLTVLFLLIFTLQDQDIHLGPQELCRGHHRQLHQAGNEVAWWQGLKIDALLIARQLWEQTHPNKGQEHGSTI